MIEVKGKATLDGSGWQAGINTISKATKGFADNGLGAIKSQIVGAFSIAGISVLAKNTIDYAGHINDLSQRLGVSVERLQEFDFAAKQNGASVDSFAGFLEKLGAARSKALDGNEEALESFREFGIEVEDLKGKRLDELTNQIANKVKDGDIQKIAGPLKAIGGKGAGDLVAAFKSGLEEAGQEARDSGLIMKESVVQQLDEIGDRFGKLGQQLMAQAAPAIAFFADGIQAMLDTLNKGAAWLGASTAQFDLSKILKSALSISPVASVTSEIAKQLGAGSVEGDKAVENVEREIVEREERIIKSRNEAKNRALFTDATDGDGTKEAKEKKIKETKEKNIPATQSDSLLKVGNFLGSSGSGMIVGIQKSQLETLRIIAKNTAQPKLVMGKALSLNDNVA